MQRKNGNAEFACENFSKRPFGEDKPLQYYVIILCQPEQRSPPPFKHPNTILSYQERKKKIVNTNLGYRGKVLTPVRSFFHASGQ